MISAALRSGARAAKIGVSVPHRVARCAADGTRRFSAGGKSSSGSSGMVELLVVGGFGILGMVFKDDIRATEAYHALCDRGAMPLIRAVLDAEQAHNAAVGAAAFRLTPLDRQARDPRLGIRVWGLDFVNPVGLAAGFDKHAEAIEGLGDMGFGLLEIGSVTPKPQPGNPKPRMFRLSEDRAVINRYGFNSEGHETVEKRLKARSAAPRTALLGVNVGKNKTSEDASADYCSGIAALGPYADYLVVNVSSPNTPGLRALQKKEMLGGLMRDAIAARDEVKKSRGGGAPLPLLVKVAPDLGEQEKKDIAEAALSEGVDGLIVSNTTVARPETLASAHRGEGGGLSGAPLREKATRTVHDFYRLTKGKMPLVGVGGVGNGADAFEKIIAGASLVQVYSMLVYEGPGAVARMKAELAELLEQHGFRSVEDAVGAAHRGFKWTNPN